MKAALPAPPTAARETGVAGLKGAFGVAVSPDGTSVYVVSLQPDSALVRLERDTSSGALSFGECFTRNLTVTTACGVSHASLAGLDGAERVATSPDGKNVYVAALSYSAVDVFGSESGGGFSEYPKRGQSRIRFWHRDQFTYRYRMRCHLLPHLSRRHQGYPQRGLHPAQPSPAGPEVAVRGRAHVN